MTKSLASKHLEYLVHRLNFATPDEEVYEVGVGYRIHRLYCGGELLAVGTRHDVTVEVASLLSKAERSKSHE